MALNHSIKSARPSGGGTSTRTAVSRSGQPAISPPGKKRILVIDDNESILADFQKILAPDADEEASELDKMEQLLFASEPAPAPEAYVVDVANQGQAGVAKVKAQFETGTPYALVFVDMRMPPGWDGVETTLRIWQVDPYVQIVICTAYSDFRWDEVLSKVGNASENLHLFRKPFQAEQMRKISNVLVAKYERKTRQRQ